MTEPLVVPAPDLSAAAASAERRRRMQPGLLGDLAALPDALAAVLHRSAPPVRPSAVSLAVFAADHGVVARQVTAALPSATVSRAFDLAAGRGPTAALAAASGVSISVVDVGIDADDSPPGVLPARVRRGSGSIDTQDALTVAELARAIQHGRDEADRQIAAGSSLLIGAVCGVGADVCAAALAAHVTGIEPVDACGRGEGVDDDAWARRAAVVRDARYRLGAGPPDAATLLRVAGGSDLAALTGFVLQAALSGIPVMLDDLPGMVAAVLAHRFAPGAERYLIVPGQRGDLAGRRLLELLGVTALLPWSLGTGIAVPSLLALPLLLAAATVVDSVGSPEPGSSGVGSDGGADRAPWSITSWDTDLL